MTMTITHGKEFPMKVGDRLMIRYGSVLHRYLVIGAGENLSHAVLETVKLPARKHATSRAFPPFPKRKKEWFER